MTKSSGRMPSSHLPMTQSQVEQFLKLQEGDIQATLVTKFGKWSLMLTARDGKRIQVNTERGTEKTWKQLETAINFTLSFVKPSAFEVIGIDFVGQITQNNHNQGASKCKTKVAEKA